MIQGTGLGLRFKYINNLQTRLHSIQWLELLADHFHDLDAPIVNTVDRLLKEFPCVLHAVNLSLGSSDPLNHHYLHLLDRLVERFNPAWVSDHLCFSHVGNTFLHDLLPIPFTNKLLDHIAFKIDVLQHRFQRPFLIENISSYLRLQGSEMSEAEFIGILANKTGCGILLDVNNIVVTCHNHQESITEFCDAIPFNRVMQIHMAGAIEKNNLLIDTHSQPIADAVMALYQQIIHDHGPIPTCLEWDADLPEFAVVLNEIEKIHNYLSPDGGEGISLPLSDISEFHISPARGETLYEPAFLQALQGETTALEALSISANFHDRFTIYKTSIVGTLQQTLYRTFKPLEALLGKDAFQELCYRYAEGHLSLELNLNRYGADLHEFSKTAPFAADLPYLSDFIDFCYTWQQIYLQGGDPVLLESDYPLYEIWQRCQPEFKGEQSIPNWQGPFRYTMYRQKGQVIVQTLTAGV